ncbi:hypothetical protein [Mucilaginibacter terrae]|uniref:Uncharacterized protein n=1 Tax=Mucilaginibacter terrae TaxID=1955052 RepID=A0ABU3GXB0_9SPHI|nr:hypothetical protein [Mucilaginibacter terrae]MDT3403310.1 hypothetical protein [Mucilaginibacter terrae]
MQATQLSYFLQEEIFLLKADKPLYQNAQQHAEITEQIQETPTDQPVPVSTAPLATIPAPATATISIAPATPAISTTPTPAITFNYSGGYQKKFLVLVHYPAADFMAADHLAALNGTLTRINYTPDDIAIVNMAKAEIKEWAAISKFFVPQKVLLLGTKAMPAAIPALNINTIQNVGTTAALYTFGFDEMMGNKDNTRIFWNLIKTF